MTKFQRYTRNRYLLVLDLLLCVFAYVAIILVIFPFAAFKTYFMNSLDLIAVTAIVYCASLLLFGIYYIYWIHGNVKDCLRLFAACLVAGVISVGIGMVMHDTWLHPKICIAANVVIMCLIGGLRFMVRAGYKLILSYRREDSKRILIIGAGRLAVALLRDICENEHLKYNVVGLIDDDPQKKNLRIYGAKVIGNRNDIERICDSQRIEGIIFAIYDLKQQQKMELLNICSKTGRDVKILPGVEASLNGKNQLSYMRDVEIEDLLGREPIQLDNALIEQDIRGKIVLVTGGGGSIGSELCRQIIKYQPKTLIILDIYENTTYELQNELEDAYPSRNIVVLIASVRDKHRLDEIFQKYKPEVVFHAAAHKHVPLMEYSPGEAIKNNVLGTYNTALSAVEHGVRRFVLISTDKAVNPTNVMGASKRMCEMIIQTLQKKGKTDYVAVRFGNVLGSNGSVIPRFKKQIAAGGPVTVTHPDITRFFMTIPEAAQLVLQAAAYARGGEIFVLDMGKPVRIYDLAKKLISLSGLKPGVDIEILFTGLRPGEKLYEELLMNEEGLKQTEHSKIFIGQPIEMNMFDLNRKLTMLKNVIPEDEDAIKQVMAEVVPTYQYGAKKEYCENEDESWSGETGGTTA